MLPKGKLRILAHMHYGKMNFEPPEETDKRLYLIKLLEKWNVEEKFKDFDWEKYYEQSLNASHSMFLDTLGRQLYEKYEFHQRWVLLNFIKDNLDEIIKEVKKQKRKIRQITEPWLVSMDQ